MDFDFDESEETASNASSSRKSASLSSRRGGVRGSTSVSLNRKRRRQGEQAFHDDDSSSLVSLERVSRVSVNPDAGTYQMLRDECFDLCSTIQSRNSSQALDAAVDLALLVSNRKTRSILWKGDKDSLVADDDEEDVSSGSMLSSRCRQSKNSTVLHSILDSLVAASSSTKAPKSIYQGTKAALPGSPARGNRTKSARRKNKEQGSITSSVVSAATESAVSTEMKQVISIIFYFLSWDCTMSDQYSVATMGLVKAPYTARKVRTAILKHGDALQGVLRLFLRNQQQQQHSKINPLDLESVVSSTASPVTMKRRSLLGKRAEWRKQKNDPLTGMASSQSSLGSSISSVSFNEDALIPPTATKTTGDPTASGRRKRRKKRRMDLQPLHPIPESDHDWPKTQIIPVAQSKSNADFSFASEDGINFAKPQSPSKRNEASMMEPASPDVSVASSVTSDISAATAAKISPKLETLFSKVDLAQHKLECGHGSGLTIQGQHSQWIPMICLDSINRIITGKDDSGPSCLDGDEDDGEADESAEENNPIVMTNNLLGKSGIVPLLARAMSESLDAVCRLFGEEKLVSTVNCMDCLDYWHGRISVLASLIDGACLFHKANRRAFCEDDPFSFEEQNKGLIFHLLVLLNKCKNGQVTTLGDGKLSGIMLLGLRTLTSLTHENELAADQLTMCKHSSDTETSSIRGLDILAELVFELERGVENSKAESSIPAASHSSDEDLHRYDSTIFCLNTLANIIEGPDVRRMLAEMKVVSSSGEILWLKWLCQWLVAQTESFHDAILGMESDNGESSMRTASQRELQKNEEDKLLAAGNGCVLLACLMKEPETISEEPESTNIIRRMIIEQMPTNQDGISTGVTMIINTLKAFCNFYHYSLGDLCFAIVTPVKKLIDELQDISETGEIR